METWVSCSYQKGTVTWQSSMEERRGWNYYEGQRWRSPRRHHKQVPEREQSSKVTPRSYEKPVANRQTVPLFPGTSCRLIEIMSKWTDLKHNGTFFSREGQRAAITMSSGLENMLKIPGSDVNVRGWRLQGLKESKTIKKKKNMQNRCSLSKPPTNGIYGDK